MRNLSYFLFDIGFFPRIHKSVKEDFLEWYYNASKSEFVREGLEIENPRLSVLALKAGTEAKKFDQNNEIYQLTSIFEEIKSKVDTFVTYIAAFVFVVGGSLAAVGVFQARDLVFTAPIQFIGGMTSIAGVGIFIGYKIIVHQMKTSSELVTEFNKELVEAPGDIRDNDQDWNRIASQFFWNRSLLSPSTHICLIFLSIIFVVSERLYDMVAEDLRTEIQEFVGMNSREIIQRQIQRGIEGDVPPRSEN